jgi:hypothetical protein
LEFGCLSKAMQTHLKLDLPSVFERYETTAELHTDLDDKMDW